jgi:hypothetical protein
MSLIQFYDPNNPDAWLDAGDTGAEHTKMVAPFNTGLLHLINYMLYTLPGRKWMHALDPAKGLQEAHIRTELKRKFAEFGVDDGAHEPLIGAHLAGFAWIAAHKAGDVPERDKQEAAYKMNVAAISWFLWEQGSGELFPLGW